MTTRRRRFSWVLVLLFLVMPLAELFVLIQVGQVIGVWWTIQAFLERGSTSVWWLGLISGIAMIVLAFWTSGQFFLEKAYTLLVFAGIWALMKGISDIARAFAVRSLRDGL